MNGRIKGFKGSYICFTIFLKASPCFQGKAGDLAWCSGVVLKISVFKFPFIHHKMQHFP